MVKQKIHEESGRMRTETNGEENSKCSHRMPHEGIRKPDSIESSAHHKGLWHPTAPYFLDKFTWIFL